MPRIDDKKIQAKILKKTEEYRSWDTDLLEKLNLSKPKKNNIETEISKRELQKGSIRVQLEPNKSSNKVQKELNKDSTKVQKGFNKSSIRVQKTNDNRVQLEFELDSSKIKELISTLSGNERELFFFVINVCVKKSSLTTGYIQGNELDKMIGKSRNSRETAIKRLCRKKMLCRKSGKRGVHGTLNLNINEVIKVEALSYLNTYISEQTLSSNWSSIRVQKKDFNRAQLGFKSDTTSSSSNITTTTEEKKFSEAWDNINTTPLKHISFSQSQIDQLKAETLNEENLNRSYITPKNIQTSIDRFAYTLKHNPAKVKTFKQDPLQVIFGVLKGGRIWTENKYESPDDVAAKQTLEALEADEKKRIQAYEERVNKISSLKFEAWKKELSETDIARIAPTSKVTNTSYDTSLDGLLSAHHKAIIRQEIKDAASKQSNTGEPISEN